MKRSFHFLVLFLGVGILTGCSRPSIRLLSDGSMENVTSIDVTYRDRSYICFHVYSIDQLNGLLRSDEIRRIDVRMHDGSKLAGRKVLIDDRLVYIRDADDSVHVVELASVKAFVPHKEVPAHEKRKEFQIGMFMGAVVGLQVHTEGRFFNPVGAVVGAVAGAALSAPFWLRDTKGQVQIINLYNEEVRNQTKVGF